MAIQDLGLPVIKKDHLPLKIHSSELLPQLLYIHNFYLLALTSYAAFHLLNILSGLVLYPNYCVHMSGYCVVYVGYSQVLIARGKLLQLLGLHTGQRWGAPVCPSSILQSAIYAPK